MKEENLNIIISEVILKELLPKILKNINDLNLESIITGTDSKFKSLEKLKRFKIKSNGDIEVYSERENDYILFFSMKEEKMPKIKNLARENSLNNLKSFMLLLSNELSILIIMKKEIYSSIKNVRKKANTDVIFRNLMIEK